MELRVLLQFRRADGSLQVRIEAPGGEVLTVPARWTSLEPRAEGVPRTCGRVQDYLELRALLETLEARLRDGHGEGIEAGGAAGGARSGGAPSAVGKRAGGGSGAGGAGPGADDAARGGGPA